VDTLPPPAAPRIPHPRTLHGETIADDWFYLRDRDNPATIPYLEAENAYADGIMAPHAALEEGIYKELVSRIQETDVSAPFPCGDFEYYYRTEQGKQYSVFCRRPGNQPGSPEEVLLDGNLEARGHDYFALAFEHVSPDGNTLAWAMNTDGSEVFTLRFRDLRTGQDLPRTITGVYYSAAWDATGSAFFYTTLDAIKRPWQLWRHAFGGSAPDELIFEEPDERFNVSIHKSRSGRYLFMTVDSHVTSEVHFRDAADSRGAFTLIAPRKPFVEYFVEHQGVDFFIRSNDSDCRNFRLLRAPAADPSPENWRQILPHHRDVMIEHVDGFENHLVVTERAEGLRRLRITDTRTGEEHFVQFDEPAFTLLPDRNEEYATPVYRFTYTSLTTPRSVFDYRMDSRERTLVKRYAVLGGYDPANYVTERIHAPSHDGTLVPISLVYRKGFARDGSHPAYLYGYGSYGIVTDPAFSSDRVSLLDRGFVFAIAHIRGSADLGRFWYEDGKLLHKKNTFFDFVACAQHLVNQRYTSPARLAIAGGSAGGLLMGASVNLRPDLFRVVVAHVPFVDVVNTMLDPTLPLTVTEYDEWGNPETPEYFSYIHSYAPYENIVAAHYPNFLVTAGLNDPRVPYWEPAKWVAKLRATKADNNTIVLRTKMGAGHGGPSGRYEKLRERAFEYAFVLIKTAHS
jgi:oligopeptidase B